MDSSRQAQQAKVLEGLRSTIGTAGPTRWASASPYLLRYLATHAVAAGNLHELTQDIGFLIYADPARLIEVIGTVDGRIHPEARLYTRAAHLLTANPAQRAVILRTMAAQDEPHLLPRFPPAPPLSARWADVRATPDHRSIAPAGGGVLAIAFATLPDGAPVAAIGSADGTVRLWDATTMTLRASLPSLTPPVCCLAFGALRDGTVLLATGDGGAEVRLWDAETLRLRHALAGHAAPVLSLAFGRLTDGVLVLATGDAGAGSWPDRLPRGTARLWDPLSGRLLDTFSRSDGAVTALAFGTGEDQGPLIAIGRSAAGYGSVSYHRPAAMTAYARGGARKGDARAERRELKRNVSPLGIGGITALAFSTLEDGTSRLVIADDHENEVSSEGRVGIACIPPSPEPLIRLSLRIGLVNALASGPLPAGEARVALGTRDGRVLLLDPKSGGLQAAFTAHHDGVTALALGVLPDGRGILLSGASGNDSTVRSWDSAISNKAPAGPEREAVILAAKFIELPDRTTLLASGEGYYHGGHHYAEKRDGYVRLRDPRNGAIRATIPCDARRVTALDVAAANGRTLLAAGGFDGEVILLDPVTGAKRKPFAVHSGVVHAVALGRLRDGTSVLATGGYDGTVETRGADGRQSPSGDIWWTYSSSDNRCVKLWDIRRRRPYATLPGYTNGGVNALAITRTPQGRTVLASGGSDIDDGERLNGARVGGAGPNGYTGVKGDIRLWDLDELTLLAVLPGQPGGVVDLAFGATSEGAPLLAACGAVPGYQVDLWDPVSATPLGSLSGHTNRVLCVAFGTLPDQRPVLASAGYDGTVRLWDPLSMEPLGSVPLSSPVHALAFSGAVLAAGTDSGLIVFDVSRQPPLAVG